MVPGGPGSPGGGTPAAPHLTHSLNRKRHSASFTFSDPGASSFQCALVKLKARKRPKPHFAACRSPKTYRHLNAARYEFFVRGANQAGTGGAATFKFRI
jgi:hypothetical protein